MSFYRITGDAQRVGNYVGIAHKAGKVAAGDASASAALKTGKARLLLLAQDTAPAVAKELLGLAQTGQLPVLYWPDKISLGLLVGKSRRGALVLLDDGFTQAILKLCSEEK